MSQVASISQQIWDMKYRLKTGNGEVVDKTINDTWRRVARALAAPEADPGQWEDRFYNALENFQFLP
ncbi:MAG: ribonucleotide reductase N-terminal alpha domain-containing protein, partial [Rhodospirillales bacterium]